MANDMKNIQAGLPVNVSSSGTGTGPLSSVGGTGSSTNMAGQTLSHNGWSRDVFNEVSISKFTCSKCKSDYSGFPKASYKGPTGKKEFTRSICEKCYCKIMDKLYELDIDGETEELLYGK